MSDAITLKSALTPTFIKECFSNSLLKEIMTDALVDKGECRVNFDLILTPGMYQIYSVKISNIMYNYGILIVAKASSCTLQLFIPHHSKLTASQMAAFPIDFAFRIIWEGSIGVWRAFHGESLPLLTS